MSWQLTRAAFRVAAVFFLSQAAALANDPRKQSFTANDAAPAGRPLIGPAWGGGGARGAAQIGVLRVFEHEHIPIDFITGTSVGAVIGGLYAAGVPLSKIQKMLEDKSLIHAYARMPIACTVAYAPLTLIPRMLGIYHYVGIYKGGRFARFLEKSLPANRTSIENTLIPFKAIATDLLSGKSCAIDHGSLGKALEASAALPWLKQPVPWQGKLLCDGFLSGANLPTAECRAMGADIVICIDLDGPPEEVLDEELRHITSFRHRTNNLLISKMDKEAASRADLLLCPNVCDLGILSASSSNIAKGILAGENSAHEALRQIRILLSNGKLRRASLEPNETNYAR